MAAILGKCHPKPRSKVVEPGHRVSKDDFDLSTAAFCYSHMTVINSLPLTALLRGRGPFQRLVLRSYSPSTNIGQYSLIIGELLDPDLTEIGDCVLVGAHATVTAHISSIDRRGTLIYLSAPVKIGSLATKGGGSMLGPGVMGEDAALEIRSVVLPSHECLQGDLGR